MWFKRDTPGRNTTDDRKAMRRAHLIELRRVEKTYQTAAGPFSALKAVDLDVCSGEFVAIIGKSGSGKSTLTHMLTGVDRPTSGEIWVGDVAVHGLTEGQMARWRGRALGVIFQFFQLLPTLTLVENVMLPMDFCDTYAASSRLARAMDLLDLVGLADEAAKLPSAVSGGQQQRAAIARALANDPPILVADEPTGNLDSKTAETIFRLFHDFVRQGKTIVMVTHDWDLACRVTRTVVIADGEVVDEIRHADSSPALSTCGSSLLSEVRCA
jgi:putative ABC transport system ATP-binding protein